MKAFVPAVITILISCACTQSLRFEHPFEVSDVSYGPSAGGKANCWHGKIMVAATAINTEIRLQSPSSQAELTQLTVDMSTTGTNSMARFYGSSREVSGEYNIYAELCVPGESIARSTSTLQFLSHGGTLDHSYWDFAPGYSYVDAAAEAGYITFNYDRLGNGNSDRPDPHQDVQSALQVEIAHILIEGLRKSIVESNTIANVVGVGHSAGSAITIGVTGKYPDDFDALVLTGISTSMEAVTTSQVSFNLLPAALDASGRFKGLDFGYLIHGAVAQDFQFSFYRYPDFDTNIFQKQFTNRGTIVFGEFLTFGSVVAPQPDYTRPVDVVLGQHDYIFCQANCSYPSDQAQIFVNALFPAARSKGTFLQPRSGHLNAQHFTAQEGFAHSLEFLKENGLRGMGRPDDVPFSPARFYSNASFDSVKHWLGSWWEGAPM